MKSADAIIIGGGIIGLSLAIELRKQGLSVLVVERAEPGREASYAAAGMLAATGAEIPALLRPMAIQSADMYPEFVHELIDESGVQIDFRECGTIVLSRNGGFGTQAESLSLDRVQSLEPALNAELLTSERSGSEPLEAAFVAEHSVDPRTLMRALIKAAKHRGVDIASGSEVRELCTEAGRATGVQTDKTAYSAAIVVNCAGAWAGEVAHCRFPVRPVKGQMLAVIGGPKLTHVIRGIDVYLVPRSDGRTIVGSTLEEAGFNKETDVETIERLFHEAIRLMPALAQARQHEAWAGLRPGTPDNLPLLGPTSIPGYFVATGHYRDGILLAPATARALTAAIMHNDTAIITGFLPDRFSGVMGS